MSPTVRGGWGVLLILATCLQSVSAETFALADASIPNAHSLNVVYKFYVKGTPPTSQNAVDFKNVRIILSPDDPEAPPASSLGRYNGLQIFVMPQADFEAATASRAFCTEQGYFVSETAKSFTNLTATDEKRDKSEILQDAGVHYLIISNCGALGGLAMRGTVAIKPAQDNSFLSPLESGAMGIYACAFLFYLVAFLSWGWACIQLREQTMMLQKGILITLGICCLESASWWLFFKDRSDSGDFSRRFFTAAALASSYKLVAIFYSVITNPGKGVHSDQGISFLMHLLPMLFLIFNFNHTIVQYLRHGYLISFFDVFISAAPAVVMGIVLLLVAVRQVSGFIETLEREKDQESKVGMYRYLKGVIFFAAIASAFMMSSQVLDIPATTSAMWAFEATVMHGLPQLVFMLCITLIMIKSWPSADLQGYAYEKQDKGDTIGVPGIDDEDDVEVAGTAVEGKGLVAAE
mmetsp:Transcript_6922/g.15773  ORF Transcript_6922/g.15773 Transcript_6922/m.15773 type:complete len:464 (-) Transcript_6922:48-1439(-)